MTEPIVPEPLNKAEQAYVFLREKIRTREYEPGYKLVLSQLADELNMSVVPVREAIRQLEAEEMITYEKNVGARVSQFNRSAYFETMETVAVLEAKATALSIPELTPEDIAGARETNEKMRRLLADFQPDDFTRLNRDFHRAVFSRCPNTRLVDLVQGEWERLEYYRVSTFRYVPERARVSVDEHERILKLIEAGAEPGYVEQVAREHRMATSDSYRKQLDTHDHPAEQLNRTHR